MINLFISLVENRANAKLRFHKGNTRPTNLGQHMAHQSRATHGPPVQGNTRPTSPGQHTAQLWHTPPNECGQNQPVILQGNAPLLVQSIGLEHSRVMQSKLFKYHLNSKASFQFHDYFLNAFLPISAVTIASNPKRSVYSLEYEGKSKD